MKKREINSFEVGEFEAALLHVDTFALDGGAMFGVVPKSIWNGFYDSDEQNRIELFGSLLFVRANGVNIIVETGVGTKLSSKEEQIYKLKNVRSISDALALFDSEPEDIDFVILTHLHLDHAGGATEFFEDEIRPTFKNAKYIVQEEEYEAATEPNERTKGSYKGEDFVPLEKYGNLRLVDGEYEVTTGVKVIKTGGHSFGHQIVVFESNGEKLLHIGDLVPTSSHVPFPYIMAYDTHPMTTLEKRKELYERIIEENMKVVFPHDINQEVLGPSDFSEYL